ncbi:hypothetical protein [Nocardiopsis sp. NPDC057823]|uniref:hypothetical protein n=1 Tax=Nocardiopsis sp. NPDC057823 TaxID=3346256 RepID=UPI00366BECFB
MAKPKTKRLTPTEREKHVDDYRRHVAEAERLTGRAHHYTYGDGADPTTGAAMAAEGQVHATLALAAAVMATSTVPTSMRAAEGVHIEVTGADRAAVADAAALVRAQRRIPRSTF